MSALKKIPQGTDPKVNLVLINGATGLPYHLTGDLAGIHIKK